MARLQPVLLNLVVIVVGAALLLFTVQRAGGWQSVADGIASVGWWFGVIVIIGAARMVCRAAAWAACSSRGNLPFTTAFAAVLAGDTAGNLTPLGLLASEPTKILMARSRLSTVDSVASVAIENVFYTVSVMVVLLTGTWFFLQRADVPTALEHISDGIVAALAIAALIGAWLVRSRPALLSRLEPLIRKLAGRAEASTETAREVELQIYGVVQWPLTRILGVVAWEVVFHVLAVTEVWVVLRQLPGGSRVALSDAFLLESAGRFVTVAFKFVPYRVGIDEAGSGAVSQVIGLGAATGVTLALVRRLRILVLNVVGLAFFTTRRA